MAAKLGLRFRAIFPSLAFINKTRIDLYIIDNLHDTSLLSILKQNFKTSMNLSGSVTVRGGAYNKHHLE
jgi:hypothetical protein